MGKIEEAIKKINIEVQKRPLRHQRTLIGEYIIDCITTEEAAEKVLNPEKTLAGAMSEIRTKAYYRKEGGMAMIEDSVVYGWAREYFGLTTNPAKKQPEATKPQTAAEAPAPAAKKKEKEVNLDFDSFFA